VRIDPFALGGRQRSQQVILLRIVGAGHGMPHVVNHGVVSG
jgi:hypothetical protein